MNRRDVIKAGLAASAGVGIQVQDTAIQRTRTSSYQNPESNTDSIIQQKRTKPDELEWGQVWKLDLTTVEITFVLIRPTPDNPRHFTGPGWYAVTIPLREHFWDHSAITSFADDVMWAPNCTYVGSIEDFGQAVLR
jgi:hypothetical protein